MRRVNAKPFNTSIRSVALVSPGWPAGSIPNGIVTSVTNCRAGLEAHGVDVSVLASRVAEGASDDRVIDLSRMEPGSFVDRLMFRIGWRLNREETIRRRMAHRVIRALSTPQLRGLDLLEMEETRGAVGLVARHAGCPVVVRLRGPWFLNGDVQGVPHDRAYHARLRAEGGAVARAVAVTSPSRDTLERTLEFYGVTPRLSAVIPNARPIAVSSNIWQLNACDRNTMLFVGRYDRHKGGDLVIDAFAALRRRFPKLRLIFAGPDGQVEGPGGLPQGLQEHASRVLDPKTLAEGFEWLGAQPHARLVELRKQALVTIVASRYESFGNTVLEAIAQGCPLVCAAVGGTPEITRHEFTALHFEGGSVESLAEQLGVILENPQFAAELGARALDDCRTRFASKAVAAQTLEFYEQVIAETAGR